ncbi:ribonuclease HII [Natrialbaceae archaeon AArc-T1-2]|uniref:ribonuclease HII n=1 Tax=Natrialbaceae archaeon AArc-T1-2 TaxID=3053904 RepID=UPI00255AF969|nr:ribonuclease HII [Natrialbaceae archaeon AArc-T1-2]WIV66810.1 ribonuclease HII [Natrialbaceae archaeon AArc-T1-2]
MARFGVDEAGKGPVLGSMFAAAVCLEDPTRLPDGVADSKRLSATRREELTTRLRTDDRIAVGVAEVPVERIDDPATDMNGLAVAAHATAIETALGDGDGSIDFADVWGRCDACDTDADRFARRVADACTVDVSLEVEAAHGADDDDPVVAAASVIAKVERDAHVANLASEYGDVGSGYPGDSRTRAFLESYVADHGRLPPIARESWSTCEDVLASAEQTGLDQF